MNKEIAAALEESIKHWEDNLTMLESNKNRYLLHGISISGDSCALCHFIIIEKARGSCTGCPVKKSTGLPSCHETPWMKINKTCTNYVSNHLPDKNHYFLLFREYFIQEIEFLKGLRDDKKNKKGA